MLSINGADRMGTMPCRCQKRRARRDKTVLPQKKAAAQGPLCGQVVLAPRISVGPGTWGAELPEPDGKRGPTVSSVV